MNLPEQQDNPLVPAIALAGGLFATAALFLFKKQLPSTYAPVQSWGQAPLPQIPDKARTGYVPPRGDKTGVWPARARAFPNMKFESNRVNIADLHPEVKKRFVAMVNEYKALTGKDTYIQSGLRSMAYQQVLYDRDKASNKNPAGKAKKPGIPSGYVAKPGTSPHERGLALDINRAIATDMDKLGLLSKYGFYRPLWPGKKGIREEWHIQIKPGVV